MGWLHTVCEEFERVKQETEKITAASGDALRQMEHQIKVVRAGLKTFTQFPSISFTSCQIALKDVGLDPCKENPP